MAKELKGYLNLYLGCEALIEGYTNRKDPFNYKGIINYQLLLESGQHYSSVKKITPILRPLSDMTEEEVQEWEKINNVTQSPDVKQMAKEFHWMLSKHFDIFGLIEAGLALNAATLETVK